MGLASTSDAFQATHQQGERIDADEAARTPSCHMFDPGHFDE
jgi:hypothetical protein